MEIEKKRRKTRWSFHSFEIGNTKTVKRHELANFRSALNAWNKNNSAIGYDYSVLPNDMVCITRIS